MTQKYTKIWINPETKEALKIKAIKCRKPLARLMPSDLGLDDTPSFNRPTINKRFKFKL